jgi:restriction endonuclease S subunit
MTQLVRLVDVAEVVRGVTYQRDSAISMPIDGYIPVLRAGNIQAQLILDQDLVWVPKYCVSDRQLLQINDLLMCTSSGSADIVGKSSVFDDENWTGSFGAFCAVIRANSNLCVPAFIKHVLRAPAFLTWARSSLGANIKNIRKSELELFEFKLPSIKEQERIAIILDKAEGLRRKRQESLKIIKELVRSTFLQNFGEPRTNFKELPIVSFGELAKLKSGEFLPSHEMAGTGGVSVYGGNGVNGEHDEVMFEDPKLVIGRVGAYCGAVHLTKHRNWITDNALYVSELSDKVRLEYLAYALTQADLHQYSSQSGQPLVSASRLYPVELVLPTLNMQDDFLEILSRIKQINNLQEDSLAKIIEMSSSFTANLLSKTR